MQFIKDKLSQLKASVLPRKNKIVNSPKELLQHLIASSSDAPDFDIHKELSQISRTSEQNAQIADFVVIKMQNFKYETAVIRKTQKLLSVTLYLIKNGGYTFSLDLKNNLSVFKELQNIDSKHFQGKFNRKAKQLDYRLEVIKHRAKYIESLVNDEHMLQEERRKAEWKRKNNIRTSIEQQDIGATSVGLKITEKFDLTPKNEKNQESTCQELKFSPIQYTPGKAVEV